MIVSIAIEFLLWFVNESNPPVSVQRELFSCEQFLLEGKGYGDYAKRKRGSWWDLNGNGFIFP
jgi:hypothetical protein